MIQDNAIEKSSHVLTGTAEEQLYFLNSEDVNIQKWKRKKLLESTAGLAVAFVPALPSIMTNEFDFGDILLSSLGLIIAFVSTFTLIQGVRKTWHLRMDAEGIELEFSGQSPDYMRWCDVNDIDISRDSVTLQSGNKKLELKSNVLGDKWKEVKNRVESKPLSPCRF